MFNILIVYQSYNDCECKYVSTLPHLGCLIKYKNQYDTKISDIVMYPGRQDIDIYTNLFQRKDFEAIVLTK